MPDMPWRSGAGYDHREYTVKGTPLAGEITSFKNKPFHRGHVYGVIYHELKVTVGTEKELNANLGLEFKGLSITVPPGTTAYLYQKVYRFKTWMWFINDAWAELNRVGGWQNYSPTHVDGYVAIHAMEWFSSPTELTGSGTVSADVITSQVDFKWTRQFNNTTEKCQEYLQSHGATIPSS
ncbi:hypothetical protein BO83DRAFT_434037 [Aspergillus eucalypticola CBS 122712]|uniref:Uncharacterized protein n=1 Tax=Aspergillus eucalypticola (strain CBS 122712 / IBT 29274) TaxID=1448314 RepID=A0A317W9B3_ASPEC|nr:uncharacterized protein BO83DRAFT_434037 [Aspergillus eucalypticola CBS 122712]PWY82331.1 hypothetical protein BO83DRAFT_434037 [Aspergillus eucalypticola CBS 122712]